jgi:V/A-type H+/Na+-transporting ATPase subunit F
MNYFCIADEDTVRGFRLAGVAGRVATTPGDADDALQSAITQPDIGIIILSEQVANGIRSQVDAIQLERKYPLIVELPGLSGTASERKDLHRSVQEAMGLPAGIQENP